MLAERSAISEKLAKNTSAHFCRERRAGGIKRRCDEGKEIYHVFKLFLMKMKDYNLHNNTNLLSYHGYSVTTGFGHRPIESRLLGQLL